MNLPSQALPLPKAYYDKCGGGYWYQDAKGAWLRLKESDFTRFLNSLGFSSKVGKDQIQSDLDRVLMDIQMGQNVDYAGSLAGYSQGLIEMEGKSVLVTDSPRIIQPVPGAFTVLQAVLMGMLGHEQLPYFQAWCKLSYEALASGNRRPGQALVLAGPIDSGKSLLQEIVTKLLGGRAAHPYLHMTGGTSFNSELFGAELLIIDDECGTSDFKSRQKLTTQFKMITAAGSQQCHPKGKPAVTLKPFWRLVVSVNDNPESLLVLPLIREDIEDKLMLFKIEHKAMPMPTENNEGRNAFWDQLMIDLPHWLHYLREWQIPAELVGARYGVRHYHNPELIEAIDGLSPEMKLFDLLEKKFNRYPEGSRGMGSNCNSVIYPPPWRGTARELETLLTCNGAETQYEARKLFSFANACARYLERLSRKFKNVISRDGRGKNLNYWCIDFRGYGENAGATQKCATREMALAG